MQPLASIDLSGIPYYGFAEGKICGVDTVIARTGYTGEDGFEMFPAPDKGMMIWDAILAAGKPFA